MTAAILSESIVDDAAVSVLVEALLAEPVQFYQPRIRTRGWPGLLRVLPAVLKEVYFHSNTELLVAVADSDNTTVHRSQHLQAESQLGDCRLCQLLRRLEAERKLLRHVPHRPQFHVAVGLAVPCLEAWLIGADDPRISEAAWLAGGVARRVPYSTRELKARLYGPGRPTVEEQVRRAVEGARRVVTKLAEFEARFPNGFGPFAAAVRK